MGELSSQGGNKFPLVEAVHLDYEWPCVGLAERKTAKLEKKKKKKWPFSSLQSPSFCDLYMVILTPGLSLHHFMSGPQQGTWNELGFKCAFWMSELIG